MNLLMEPLGDLLTTHPIQTVWEITIERYLSWRFGIIDHPDSQFGNPSLSTWTWTRPHVADPLLTAWLLCQINVKRRCFEYTKDYLNKEIPSRLYDIRPYQL